MVNRMGSTFWMRMQNATGHPPAAIARAYTAAREIFGMRAVWQAIESLDNRVITSVQLEMLIEARRLLDRATLWLLRHSLGPVDIAATIARYGIHSAPLAERLPRLLKNGERAVLKQRERQFIKAGVPKELAAQIAGLDSLITSLDLTEIAERSKTEILRAAEIYYTLSATLDLFWLKEQIHALPRRDLWQRKARNGLLEELYGALRILTQDVLETSPDMKNAERRLDAWFTHNTSGVEHWRGLVADIRTSGKMDLAKLSVAMREIRALARNAHH
jgi:glutamate dehydrogenase